jgi:hypothetical protein
MKKRKKKKEEGGGKGGRELYTKVHNINDINSTKLQTVMVKLI